jgi:hypothetical protein
VYIGRPSKWGNPFSHKAGTAAKHKVNTRKEAIMAYRTWLWASIEAGSITFEELATLDGKVLGCWCHPKPCHGDVLTQAAAFAADEIRKGRSKL